MANMNCATRAGLHLLLSAILLQLVSGSLLPVDIHLGGSPLLPLTELTGNMEKADAAGELDIFKKVTQCSPYRRIGCFTLLEEPVSKMSFLMDRIFGEVLLSDDQLACLCATITTEVGSKYFSVSNGECFHGDVAPDLQHGRSDECYNFNTKSDCTDGSTGCAGYKNGTYVYQNRIDGRFTLWSQWSTCTAPCMNKLHTRTRSCTQPPPSGGGRECNGRNEESRSCCSAGFTSWTHGPCNVKCGTGVRTYTRTCTDPSRVTCFGATTKNETCTMKDCPAPFTRWTTGPCGVACGLGSRKKTRRCTNPQASTCTKANTEKTIMCFKAKCPGRCVDTSCRKSFLWRILKNTMCMFSSTRMRCRKSCNAC